MQVTVLGAQETRAKLAALPGRLRQQIQLASPRAAETEVNAIRSETPRLTGALAGSIHASVTNTAQGVQSRVLTDLRYAPFVDRGTRQHGPARHMFERGSEQVKNQVEDIYRVAVDEATADF